MMLREWSRPARERTESLAFYHPVLHCREWGRAPNILRRGLNNSCHLHGLAARELCLALALDAPRHWLMCFPRLAQKSGPNNHPRKHEKWCVQSTAQPSSGGGAPDLSAQACIRSRGRAPNILVPPPHLRLMNTCSWNCFILLCDHTALDPLPNC